MTTKGVAVIRSDQQEHTEIDWLLQLNESSVPQRPGTARRGQHPKHHGCVTARFRVRPDCPPELRHGIFAEPNEYAALIRFSNGRVWDDRKRDAHGMAVKLLLNENLLGVQFASDGQDFVLVDSETFFTGDPAEYRLVNEATLSRSRFASI